MLSLKEVKAYYKKQSIKSCLTIHSHEKGLKQIVLIRHGEPDVEKIKWCGRKEAESFNEQYDRTKVISCELSPICSDNVIIKRVYSSPVPRAKHTAELLFPEATKIITDSRFREFERKILSFPDLYLPLKFWTVSSRILWLLGLNSRGIESKVNAYKRVEGNSAFLIEEAEKQELVVLVSHGFHNKVLIQYIRKQGWELVRNGGNGYWAINILAIVT